MSLRKSIAAETPPPLERICDQCECSFVVKSGGQRYCDDRCRWDHSAGRASELSKTRRETGFAWPPASMAKPVIVRVPKAKAITSGYDHTALILPDTQFGFWRALDGSLIPMHDEAALTAALAVAEKVRPYKIVHVGDLMDFPEFGKYIQEPGFAQTTQEALNVAHSWIAKFRACCQEMVILEGNHDMRIVNSIMMNSKSAAGIKQANSTPEEWPILSVPHLLRLDELDVEYVDGYPVGFSYLNDRICCTHGAKIGSRGKSAQASVVEDERVSVVSGHTHKAAIAYKTRSTRDAMKQTLAYSPGCLCDITGRVPGVKQGMSRQSGTPRLSWADWQQGVGLVHYDDGDGDYKVEHIEIIEGVALFRSDRLY